MEAAGSLRRGKETVGDLDLLVTGPNAGAALEHIVNIQFRQEVLGQGGNKASVSFGIERLQVDVRALPHESFGAAMQYFTGSKEHNVALRTVAIKQGLTLNEYGLFKLENNERVAGETEEEIYQKLGYAWIPPEMRENCGELEAAQRQALPKLVQLSDMRGDLHMHTTETDGKATLREMAEAAAALGYEYIAITDHSKALAMSNGLDEKRVVEFAKQVRELNREGLPLHVFAGLECDILRDGAMDLSEDALAELDLVIGSIHSHMKLESNEMTESLAQSARIAIAAHFGPRHGEIIATARILFMAVDRVATQASARKVCFEVNASPERLDLPGPIDSSSESQRMPLHHFNRCTPPGTFEQHAIRSAHGPARLVGSGGHSEHAPFGRFHSRDKALIFPPVASFFFASAANLESGASFITF